MGEEAEVVVVGVGMKVGECGCLKMKEEEGEMEECCCLR